MNARAGLCPGAVPRPSALLARRSAGGLTLVELLVGLAIGLVVSLIAATAYIGSRGAATATENVSRINETGRMALEFIGRDIQMAGFYPALAATAADIPNVIGRYTNVIDPAKPAYNQGLFGCDGAVFDLTTGACPAPVAGQPDSIVVNYFTLDVGNLGNRAGQTTDCNRSAINTANQPYNQARGAAVPPLPMAISNRYMLVATSYNTPNGPIATRSVACQGNGTDHNPVNQPIFEGIEDMVIRYGVHNGTGVQSPDQFYTAAQVSAMPVVDSRTGWQRVTAVRVCLVVRSLSNTRTVEQGTGTRSYQNCRGGTTDYDPSDRTLYRRFEQTFAARNNLNGTN